MQKYNIQIKVNNITVPFFNKDMYPAPLPTLEIAFYKDSGITKEVISESTGYRLYRELKRALNLN